jgi:hypothetical protein
MAGELIINGKDAYTEWGVSMGDKFLDALGEIAGMKEYVTNNNRLKDGVDYVNTIPKIDERSVTLTFTITGENSVDFLDKKNSFYEELYHGDIALKVPANGNEIYHLKYKNSTGAYAQNIERTFAKLGVKFQEPNVKNRV